MSDSLYIAAAKRLGEIDLRVDLRFASGVTALAGPSGAGKSTLLRMVAGLVRPESGTIRLGETMLDDAGKHLHLSPAARQISLVFQEYALFPHLSVAQNVAYGLRARRVPRPERRLRVQDMLERLGIATLARERPGRLSGGQRQRVALARALVTQPRALLLDEPLAALDVQTRASVRLELRAVLADLAIPTLLVTHDYADALAFRERVVVLVDGTVVQDGPHAELLSHPRSRFVAEFTGLNFVDGTLLAHDAGSVARIQAYGAEIFAVAEQIAPGPVTVALRPWEVTLSRNAPEGSARNVFQGRVREVLPLGGRVRVTLAAGPVGNLALVAEVTPEAMAALDCREGQLLYAAFKATAVTVTPR